MKNIFVMGAAGFVGRELVRQAIAGGLVVTGLVRRAEQARELRGSGASVVLGDARESAQFAAELSRVDAVIDLIQPSLPGRVTNGAIRRAASERLELTRSLLDALGCIPESRRPLLVSVSGTADLQKDGRGLLSAHSAQRATATGFAQIGVPVHELVARSGFDAAFVYLGTVYGAGKAFAARLLPALARGRLPIIGRGENRMALTHISDAGRALAHLLALDRAKLEAKTWLVADGANSTQREFLAHAAELMEGPAPRSLPRWLVSSIAGAAVADQMSNDAPVDNSALLATGFRFEYPSHESGLPVTVRAFRARARAASAAAQEPNP